ncbi:MAG: competence protein CoiA family protein [Gemmatimonadaceae bacterium]
MLVDARPAHVSWFAHLPARRRPAAHCPECGGRLILKLGAILRHHAAHAADSRCAATRPETALHSDLKYHIAARLQRAAPPDRRITVRRRCPAAGAERCVETRDDVWCTAWDDVRVERSVLTEAGPRRPDLLLYANGTPLAAIEVLVSHAAADSPHVPWLEVRAHEALIDGDESWDVSAALPAERIGAPGAPAEEWRCAVHAAAHARLVATREAQRAADANASHDRLLAARVVDIYHPEGSRERLVYRVEEQVNHEGSWLVLRRGTREIGREPLDSGDRDSLKHGWLDLRAAAARDAKQLTPAGGFRDSPMRWATHDAAENIVREGLYDVVPGDTMPLATRYPRRWFFARDAKRWFVPVEMRGVRWDRAAGDAFAAHPAWAESRRAVRERPSPSARDDRWTSFVFAGRPNASLFGVTDVTIHDGGAIAILRAGARVLAVLTRAASEETVRDVERRLVANGAEHLWLSHPRDWSAERGDLAWVAAGRDGRARGVVLVDGDGVYTAERFARAFAGGDARLRPEVLRRRSAERVRHLGR